MSGKYWRPWSDITFCYLLWPLCPNASGKYGIFLFYQSFNFQMLEYCFHMVVVYITTWKTCRELTWVLNHNCSRQYFVMFFLYCCCCSCCCCFFSFFFWETKAQHFMWIVSHERQSDFLRKTIKICLMLQFSCAWKTVKTWIRSWSLIWVYTICSALSVQILRINT